MGNGELVLSDLYRLVLREAEVAKPSLELERVFKLADTL